MIDSGLMMNVVTLQKTQYMIATCMVQQYGQQDVWKVICMVQPYEQKDIWCCSETTMLHGVAMIHQWDIKGNLVQYGAAYGTSMGKQWSVAYNAQWDNEYLVQQIHGMEKHSGTTMTMCDSGTIGQP